MKLLTVEHALPERRVTNDDVVEVVRREVADLMDAETWRLLEKRLRRSWEVTGTSVRYMTGDGERALDLTIGAAREALRNCSLSPADIDLVIYTGVGRAVLEPAMASIVQAELGIRTASCFDVLEACQSWLRALQLSRSLINSGEAHTALIVNCEAALMPLADFALDDPTQVDRLVGATTVGEAATATVVTADDPGAEPDDFYFRFRNLGEHYGVCMIPLPSYGDMVGKLPLGDMKPMRFYTDSSELMRIVSTELVKDYLADCELSSKPYDIVFSHQASERVESFIRRRMRIPSEICVSIHRMFGNTVSATVPLGMSLALKEGRWQRGHRTLVVVGSGGISLGFARFTL